MPQRCIVSILLVLSTFGWCAGGVGEEVPTPRGEQRIVDKNPNN